MTRRIGYATCAKYPELAAGDRLSASLLRNQGWEVVPVVWSEVLPESIECDVIVIRSVWDYHLHVEQFLDWVDGVAERARVLNSPKTIGWNADKRYLFELERAGVPVPRMALLEQRSVVDVADVLRRNGFREAVIKPVVSASAFGTYRVNVNQAQLVQVRVDELLRSRTLMIQEYVPEITSAGEWSLMFFRGEYSHAVRKLPRAGDFRVQAEHGGRHEAGLPPDSILKIASQVVNRFAAETLYARIDIVEQSGAPLIMEVELIDPELFLGDDPEAAGRFVAALNRLVNSHEKHC